jgi:replication factor A1
MFYRQGGGISLEELMKIAELNPSSRQVHVKFQVIEKGTPNEVVSRKDGSSHRVSEILVGDPSGCVLLTLWNEDIDLVEEGGSYNLLNGYVNVFKDSMRLNLVRYGQLEKTDEEIQASQENNISEKKVERGFRPRRSYRSKKGYRKRRY